MHTTEKLQVTLKCTSCGSKNLRYTSSSVKEFQDSVKDGLNYAKEADFLRGDMTQLSSPYNVAV